MKQTSISAYREITDSGRKKTHSERIYAAMLKHGAGTYEQIATYANMQDRQVWKRLSELERDGMIFDSGRTATLSSGKEGTIWVVNATAVQIAQPTETPAKSNSKPPKQSQPSIRIIPVFSRAETSDVVNTSIVPLLTKKKQRNVPIPETTTFKRWIQLDLFRDN